MSEILKPLMLDETGKAIVEALTQQDMTQTRIEEINTASNTAKQEIKELTKTSKQSIETKTNEQLARIPEVTELSGDVNQLKDDVAAITPDDTVVDGKPWTSKKTVDSLCMPLEATGNPVKVYPVEGYPLGARVSWGPVQAGSGDPSPDNIRPIRGRDAVSVTRCGRTLVEHIKQPGYTVTSNGVTFTVNGDYSIAVKGTATTETYFNFRPLKNYYPINHNVNAMDKTVTKNGFTLKDLSYEYAPSKGGSLLYLVIVKGQVVDRTYYPMMIFGGDTAYEPYTGSTTDIALPETVYGGTLDVETGVVTVTHNVIDMSQARFEMSNTPAGVDWVSAYVTRRVLPGGDYTGDLISSHNVPEEYSKSIDVQGVTVWYAPSSVGVAVPKSMTSLGDTPTNAEIIAAIRAVCTAQADAGTPVQICYKLVTPYANQLTPQQIAALSGVNTLYTDAGTLTVTGREDPRHTIVTLTDRIAALESAAAGV